MHMFSGTDQSAVHWDMCNVCWLCESF